MELNAPSGVLILNKSAGMTSHDAVNKIRRLFSTKQVGHTGTLDPMATGVLPILLGRAVKASEYLLSDWKGYKALLQLGVVTDTGDTTGRILEQKEHLPPKEQVFAVCSSFVGEQTQIPPMYSALKVNGQKLCDLARRNIEVERAPRPITVRSLIPQAVDEEKGLYSLSILCSKGTYIRSLCTDIGKALSCGGSMAGLIRTQSGHFFLEKAHTLQELEEMNSEERSSLLLPVESLFSDLPAVTLPPFYRRLCSSGCPIYLSKLGLREQAFPDGQRLRLYDGSVFFALGEVGQHPEGKALKAIKQFVLFENLPGGAAGSKQGE